MDIELTDFPNLKNILDEYGNVVVNAYRQALLTADKKDTSNLINNISANTVVTNEGIGVELTLPYYWKYVEEGIKPAGKHNNPTWKAYPFILKWVEHKPVKWTKNGRELPAESTAYLATKKIVDKGIEPTYILKGVVDTYTASYKDRIMSAVKMDISEMHKKIWAGFKF